MTLFRMLAARHAGLAWALAADAAWHLAGPAWAATVLILAAGWLAGRLPAAIVAASAKAYAAETRVDALVPDVHEAKTAAAAAQSTADTAMNTIPANHGFLGGLETIYTGSDDPGGSVGGVPAQSSYYCGVPPPATYNQGSMTAYGNHINYLADDITALRGYLSSFASSYNNTVSFLNYIQDQFRAHGYSAT